MRHKLTPWLLRGAVIIFLVAIVILWVLVHPLQESEPVPTPTAIPTQRATYRPTATHTRTATPCPTPTARPTDAPTPSPSATPTSSPTTITPTPTITLIEAPVIYPDADLAGRVEQGAYASRITGGEAPYRIYLPPDYDGTERRYPVLYLLHGWPYDESHWDNLGVDEVADSAIQAGQLPPFLIVLPGAAPDGVFVNTAGGSNSFEDQVINELVPHIDATYRTLANREGRAIGGISRGGVWSLEIGFRHADMFAAVGGHSPALEYNRAPDAYNPFKLLNQPRVPELRVYLDAGDGDWALDQTRALHEALSTHGIPNQFMIHTGGHSDGLWAANLGEYLTFYAADWSN